jgi:GR25 family glycosyltransferase involved in LPS biosynthesis
MFNEFEPVYVVNLKRREDRKRHIESLFAENSISNYSFIEAFDAKESLASFVSHKPQSKRVTKTEIASLMSHLKAIKTWVETSETDFAIICEDDIDFELSKYWGFTWKEFISSIPYEYDVLQLGIHFIENNHNIKMHKKRAQEYSASIYLIKREYAKELINKYFVEDGKYNLNYSYPELIPDHFAIFKKEKCFSMALLIPIESFGTDNRGKYLSVDGTFAPWPPESKLKEMINNRNKIIDIWKNNTLTLDELLCKSPS